MVSKSCLFRVDNTTGRLAPASRCDSPNQDPRPDGAEPELIVVHGISLPPGEFGGEAIEALFTNTLDFDAHPYYREIRGLEVSAHLLIRRDGHVVQFVPFTHRAWHAGESRFRGRGRCNDFSIGIELEGLPGQPFTGAQYATLAALVEVLRDAFPGITAERVVGHSDIAPGRKEDPGPRFDWARLRRLAALV